MTACGGDVSLLTPALAWGALPESLDGLATFSAQLQAVTGFVIAHPLWSVGALILAVVLLQVLADLLRRLLKSGLTFLLKLPLLLSQWLWERVVTSRRSAPVAQASQVEHLISRLEALRAEQDEVVTELKRLLAAADWSDSLDAYPPLVAPTASTPASPTEG